jgi:hypothetical protein
MRGIISRILDIANVRGDTPENAALGIVGMVTQAYRTLTERVDQVRIEERYAPLEFAGWLLLGSV